MARYKRREKAGKRHYKRKKSYNTCEFSKQGMKKVRIKDDR